MQTLDINPGLEVLDVGCGDGTTALTAARLGIPSNPVTAGNERARAEGGEALGRRASPRMP